MGKQSKVVAAFAVMAVLQLLNAKVTLAQDAVRCVNVTPPDSRFASCPTTQDPTIQDAVNNAGSGDMIFVGSGTYAEQVRIGKPLTVQGAGASSPPGLTVIMPVVVAPTTTSLFSSAPIAAIVLVDMTAGVAVTDLTVDGMAAAFPACSPGYDYGQPCDEHSRARHRGLSGSPWHLRAERQREGPGLNAKVAWAEPRFAVASATT